MIFGSLSANGWGCVHVFLVIWHGVSSPVACWSLSAAGLSVEMEISGRAFSVWYYEGLGGLWWTHVLNTALPSQRLRPDTRPEHEDPVSHTAASVGMSSEEAGSGCGSPRGRGHWQQRFWKCSLAWALPVSQDNYLKVFLDSRLPLLLELLFHTLCSVLPSRISRWWLILYFHKVRKHLLVRKKKKSANTSSASDIIFLWHQQVPSLSLLSLLCGPQLKI